MSGQSGAVVTKERRGFLDAGAPDAFERGAVVPEVVEQLATRPLAAGAVTLVWVLVRLALFVLLVHVLVNVGRDIYALAQVKGVGQAALLEGPVVFFFRIEEVMYLREHLPTWAAVLGGIAFLLVVWFVVDDFGDFLGEAASAVGATGSKLATLAVAASMSVVDRLISAMSRPLGRWRELAARIAVIALNVFLIAKLVRWFPPGLWLDVFRVTDTVSIHGVFWHQFVLGLSWFVIAFLAIQALWQVFGIVRLARATRSSEVVPWKAPTPDPAAASLSVIHWSDLHITPFDDSLRTDRKNVGGNVALRMLVDAAVAQGDAVDVVIVTGDTTDAGRSTEWAQFFEIARPVADRLVLVPGNHDLNIVDPLRYAIVGDDRGCGHALREIRMMAALDRVQGDRALVVREGDVCTLSEHLAVYQPILRAFYERPSQNDDVGTVHDCYRRCFPMLVPLANGFAVYVFDSNDPASTVATNAFGLIRDDVLERFEVLSRHAGDNGPLIAMHHHLGYPDYVRERGVKDRLMANFIVLQNARDVVRALARLGNVVVMHGHRHIGYEGRIDDAIEVMSSRSSTLGDAYRGEESPGFQQLLIERVMPRGTRVVSVSPWRAPAARAEGLSANDSR